MTLSPILFILTLKPFLCCIRQNPDIQGIKTTKREYKLAAFADDILLFLTNPHTTIPVLLEEFQHFNLISNLKINFSKSFALNISLPLQLVTQCKENFSFQWKSDAITYLVIQLTAKLANLYTKNYLPTHPKQIDHRSKKLAQATLLVVW